MNGEDRRIEIDGLDASPQLFGAQTSNARPHHSHGSPQQQQQQQQHEQAEDLAREITASSISTRRESAETNGGHDVARWTTEHESPFDLERHPTALSRIKTARSQHEQTVGTSLRSRTVSRASKKPLPNFGGGKPYPPPLPERGGYVVEFDGPGDPLHPQNWPLRKKLPVAVVLGYVTLTAAFGSSVFSAATSTVAAHFGVSSEVGILGVSLYVLGFATGPMLWAPMSELYGRKWPLLISSFGFSIFSIAVAVAKDVPTVFICRFFGGFFGACPLAVVGAVFADLFNNRQRGLAITVFSIAVFAAWLEMVLVHQAADLRRRTKNWGIHAKQEEIEIDFRELVEKNLSRPMRMLFTEPIVLSLSIYMAFVYGLLYLFLTFYPIVFQQIHGMNKGVGGLPFIGMILGEMLAGVYMIIAQPSYNRKLAANDNIPVPEWRMPPAIVGGVLFALGIFWFGWTGYSAQIHWIAPTLSGLFTGFGIMSIFLQGRNYLIDAYLMFAASAIAANTFLRSLCGAGSPLFATYMIEGMGVQWAGTLLGGVALALVPLPVMFHLKGAKLRSRSRFAPGFPIASRANASLPASDEEKEI